MLRFLLSMNKRIKYFVTPSLLSILFSCFLIVSFERTYVLYCTSVDDIDGIRKNLSGNYFVRNQYLNFGNSWIPIGTKNEPFIGTFDGNGTTVTALNYCPSEDEDGFLTFGLFGYNYGTIKNVNFYVYGSNGAIDFLNASSLNFFGALLCAYNYGTIENCNIAFAGNMNCPIDSVIHFGAISGLNAGQIISTSVRGSIEVFGASEESVFSTFPCFATEDSYTDISGQLAIKYSDYQYE